MTYAADPRPSSTGILKSCALLGPLFTLMWLGGAGPVSGFTFVLPPSAANSSAETLASYLEHLTAIRVGCVLMIFSACLYTCWNIAISNLARRLEGPRPILFHIQVISVAACVVVVMFIGFFWGVAAFRAGQTSPEITQALNDLGWFGVLFTGAPFAVYQIALGAAIIRSDGSVFPRWSAYLNFFVSVFMVEASLILFFKTGAFSQNGLAVFYLPMISFFVWICTMSWLTYRAANAEQRAERAAAAGAADVAPATAGQSRVRVGA